MDARNLCQEGLDEFDLKVITFKRLIVGESLAKCTQSEIVFFNRMYKSIEEIEESKMRQAYSQCYTTLQKRNNENA